MDWFYIEQGLQVGPLSEQEFGELVQLGRITADTPVWQDGMKDWQRYGELQRFPSDLIACSECQREFPPDELISYKNVRICASCKPLFFQKVKEGAPLAMGLAFAGFWIRFWAKLIDGFFILIAVAALSVGVFVFMGLTLKEEAFNPDSPVFLFFYPILWSIQIAYSVWFLGRYSATPGKMLTGLKVVTSDGNPMTYKRAFGRFFAELLSSFTCNIGYIMAAFDEEKRALHDRICDTRVIRK